ncbi:rhomboid domain-containing protein 2-like [Xyrauchen texanus]|uniref:rhomboid domain-containing protein 2-like n=1 Tax=Xyrauchen texanus TaxID=154827 RepID=UPI0022427779|nr:rhomboid domain-containing protein 2-like [Xyrauchen texanus]
MHNTFKNWKHKFADLAPDFDVTCGIAVVIVLSCVLSVLTYYSDISDNFFSLESSDVLGGHVYKLFTYCLYHKNMTGLVLSAIVMLYPCTGLEKGVGTVRFLYQLLLLSAISGLLHVLLESLLFSPSYRSSVNGLIPLALSVLGRVTVSSAMQKAYLMGINVPTTSLPWIFLIIITLFFPDTFFICNVLAIITGTIYGKGWFSLLDMSEPRASVLEKRFPFRLLKQIPGVQFIPASAEECKKRLDLTDIPPGSYPVQAYAPVNAATGQPNTFNGWPHSTYPQQNYTFPPPFTGSSNIGIGHGHLHGHSHHQFPVHHTGSPSTPMSPYATTHLSPPFNMTGQPVCKLPQPGVPFTPQISHSESGVPVFPPTPSEYS